MDQNTLNRMLIERAVAIADARVQRNKDMDSRLKTPKYADTKWVNPRTYFGEALAFLKDKYGNASDAELGDLIDTKDQDLVKWIWERGPSPKDIKGTLEAREFLKLLNGVAPQGEDWYTMGTEALKGKAVDMGWKVNTPERFNEFLKKLGEYQAQYDRAKNVEELRNMPGYTLSSFVYPSAMKEIENAVATGEGGDKETVTKMAITDGLINAGMLWAPNLAVSKTVPIVNAGVGASTQALLEAARQYAAEKESKTGQEFNAAMPLAAGTLGATTPALVGVIRGGASKIPGESAARFSRGSAKAIKTTDPELAEKSGLVKDIAEYNKTHVNKLDMSNIYNDEQLDKLFKQLSKQYPSAELEFASETPTLWAPFEPAVHETESRLASLPKNLKVLFGDKALNQGGIDAAYVLDQYNKPIRVFDQIGNGSVMPAGPTGKAAYKQQAAELYRQSKNPLFAEHADELAEELVEQSYPKTPVKSDIVVLDEKTLPVYQKQFPAKWQASVDDKPGINWFKTGKWITNKAQDFGSSVEPTFKFDPRNPSGDDDYKKTEWYQKLDEEKKKLIDDAFDKAKKKREGK